MLLGLLVVVILPKFGARGCLGDRSNRCRCGWRAGGAGRVRRCSWMRAIAWRIARVTPDRARSDADPARRPRPPRPTARDSSRRRKSRSASACSSRMWSRRTRACSMSSSISGESPAVGGPGFGVQHLAGIAEREVRGGGFVLGGDRVARVCGHEVGDVELTSGMSEQPGEMAHAFAVSDNDRAALEGHGPRVADAPERIVGAGTVRYPPRLVRLRRGSGRGAASSLFDDRAGGAVFEPGALLVAAGPAGVTETASGGRLRKPRNPALRCAGAAQALWTATWWPRSRHARMQALDGVPDELDPGPFRGSSRTTRRSPTIITPLGPESCRGPSCSARPGLR